MIIDYKSAFESAPAPYLLLDRKFDIVALSNSYAKATMIKREDVIGRNVFDVFPDNPDDFSSTASAAKLRASLERAVKFKRTDLMAVQKYDVRRPDGIFEERYWSPLNTPVPGADGEVQYIIHRVEDVTELVLLKNAAEQSHVSWPSSENNKLERLRQSQRMEVMGQLASGVAHDFNNILATITLTCESTLRKSNVSDSTNDGLTTILDGCNRAASLTRQLLAFSRKQVQQPKALNINTTVSGMHMLLGRVLSENIRLHFELSADLGNTLIDPGQVEQIVLNFAINARDAMPNGGTLTVITQNADLDVAMTTGKLSVKPGKYVKLSVSDTGVGMSPATQARIFEPYFTTKPEGKGTGLGLATVYGIVQQNNGTILCYSELGHGSVFKIYLPLDGQPADVPAPEVGPLTPLQAAGKTILVAEDEPQLRHAIVSTLKAQGYKLIEAENGERVLEILGARPGSVDLIVTDVVMPRMGGQELTRQLTALGLKTKILYLSGYTQDVLDSHGVEQSHPHFLEKPFRLDALLAKIREILS